MINLSKYHSHILAELNTRGLLDFIFEAEEDKKEDSEEKIDNEEPEADGDLEASSEEKKSESSEDESSEDESNDEDKKLIQQPNSLDAEINKMLNKAEKLAISSAKQKTFESIKKCKSSKKISILYESNDRVPLIDVEQFANQVARYVNNYDSFIDMPQLIIKQAINFLKKNYDEETAEQFEQSLRDMYNLEIVKSPSPPGSKLGVPNAVGAKQTST
jgi:ribosomal protein S7